MSKKRKKVPNQGADEQKLAAQQSAVSARGVVESLATSVEPHASMQPIEPEAPLVTQQVLELGVNEAAAPSAPHLVAGEAEASAAPPPATTEPASAPVGTPFRAEAARPADADITHGSLGQRLRAAREVNGWSAEDVGSRLRLPVQIIQRIEAEQFEKIGYDVYLRGYLTSYAKLVGIPTVLIESVLRDRNHAPTLVSSGTISHSRYLYQRYSVSALYLILTAVIIVPAVMLAMRASMEPGGGQLAALNPAPGSSTTTGAGNAGAASPAGESSATTSANGSSASNPAPAATSTPDSPLVASLAPFPTLSHADTAAHVIASGAGSHTLKLTLKEASWVEVTSATGEKLEYGLLPAGSVRKYSSDKVLEVRLGNCSGAEVETDGVTQDLTPFRRSNVAHFKLFSGSDPISHTDS